MVRARTDTHCSGMQITRAADYALRALIYLAQMPEGYRVPLGELAHGIDAPESFLSKVMQALCRAGFAASRRGQAGGFAIHPRGCAALVAEVIEAIDGPCALNACLSDGVSCNRRSWCPAHPVWAAAQEAMLSVLRARSIAGLASRVAAPVNRLVEL